MGAEAGAAEGGATAEPPCSTSPRTYQPAAQAQVLVLVLALVQVLAHVLPGTAMRLASAAVAELALVRSMALPEMESALEGAVAGG